MRLVDVTAPVGLIRSVAAFALVMSIAAGCAATTTPEVAIDDPVLEQGRDLYVRQCSACHGSEGGGGRGVKLNDGAVVAAYPEIADQIAVVSQGKNAMPAFGGRLDDAQLEAVVRYTREVLSEVGGPEG